MVMFCLVGEIEKHMARGVYLRTKYLTSSKRAILKSVDSYNQTNATYRNEQTLILLTNALELLAKAVLLKRGKSINERRDKSRTIPAQNAIQSLLNLSDIDGIEHQTLQQVISLRDAATHSVLPHVPKAVMQHLVFLTIKTYRNLLKKHFKSHDDFSEHNFLAVSIDETITYADEIGNLLRQYRRGNADLRNLIWLLEKGVSFDGTNFKKQPQFEKDFLRSKKNILGRVKLGEYLNTANQVKFVLVQAPKNYTANIELRKGSHSQKLALPVITKKTDVEDDFPKLTVEIAENIGKSQSFVALMLKDLGLKGDPKYHQPIRTSKRGMVQRYSNSVIPILQERLKENPDYTPYKKHR